MSFKQIEREYDEISRETKEPAEMLPRLISIVENILNTLNKMETGAELKKRTQIILNNLRNEDSTSFTNEKATAYLSIVKDILALLKEIVENEEPKVEEKREETLKKKETDYDTLSEDINIIDRILEEEISDIEPVRVEEPVVTAPQRERKTLETVIYELENLKEYVRILSDKLFDIGEEILDIKERVSKLEDAITKGTYEAVKPTAIEKEPKQFGIKRNGEKPLVTVSVPPEYLGIKDLIEKANRELGLIDENILKRAIKLESYKIQLENNKDRIISAPETLKKEYEKTYSRLVEQTNLLRKKIQGG